MPSSQVWESDDEDVDEHPSEPNPNAHFATKPQAPSSAASAGWVLQPASRYSLPPEIVTQIVDFVEDVEAEAARHASIRAVSDYPQKATRAALSRACAVARCIARCARPRLYRRVMISSTEEARKFLCLLEDSVVVARNPRTGGKSLWDCSPAPLIRSLTVQLSPPKTQLNACGGILPSQLASIADSLTNLEALTVLFAGAHIDLAMFAAIEKLDRVERATFVSNGRISFWDVADLLPSFSRAKRIHLEGVFLDNYQRFNGGKTVLHSDEVDWQHRLDDEVQCLILRHPLIGDTTFRRFSAMIVPNTLCKLELVALVQVSDNLVVDLVRAHSSTLRDLTVIRQIIQKLDHSRFIPFAAKKRMKVGIRAGDYYPGGIQMDEIVPPGPDGLLGDLCAAVCPNLVRLCVGGPVCVSVELLKHLASDAGAECHTLELISCAPLGGLRRETAGESDATLKQRDLDGPGLTPPQIGSFLKGGRMKIKKLVAESCQRWWQGPGRIDDLRATCIDLGIEMGGQLLAPPSTEEPDPAGPPAGNHEWWAHPEYFQE